MNSTKRPLARILVGGLLAAGTAAAVVPGVASANRLGCVGKTIHASETGQHIHGTPCADTIVIGQFGGVTVFAGGGNDTVNVGFGPGPAYVYLQDGHDTLVNPHNRQIWADGGAGNDTIDGSSHNDWIYGGAGTDSATINTGDDYHGIEDFK